MKSIEELRTSYNDFIENQRRGYEITAAMIGYIIQKMQEASIIKGEVKISGRIKSFKSAYENTGKKAVDDCFGLRIVADRADLEKIKEELKRILVVDSTKDHSKKKNTTYNALHQMVHLHRRYADANGIEPERFPEIEIQYWDEELREKCVLGELSYANYKKRDLMAIIRRLDEEPERALMDLPTCYEVKGNNIRVLAPYEALYKLYPEIKELEEKRRTLTVAPVAIDVGVDVEDPGNR